MSDASAGSKTLPEPRGWLFLGAAACALAVALQIAVIHAHSLSGDGAHHLVAGHQALRYGQNTLNLEHPPLVKLVAALPLLFEEPVAAPLRVEHALTATARFYARPELRRATIRGRYLMLAVFVLPFLLACYALGKRFGDHRGGIVLALMSALSLAILPYLTVLQTDVAVALAFTLTVLQATRYAERPSVRTAVQLALACGLGLAVKFSAVLLGPTVLASVFLARGQTGSSWRRRLGHLALIGVIALALLEASYLAANRTYSSDVGREVIRAYCDDRGTVTVDDRMLGAEPALLAVERIDPRLAQWLTGLWGVHLQDAIGVYSSFAFGEIRSQGRWWYFPAVLLIKTPIPILLAALAALARRRSRSVLARWRSWLPMALTTAIYLAAAVTSSYNLSVRHLLPVLPFLYLPVAVVVARSRAGTMALIGALAIESMATAPLWMSHTNTWWLGARNPTRFALAAGNLEYRQNFIQLARQVEDRGLGQLNVLYPTIGEEVLRAYLPSARLVVPGEALGPGWYAVNVIVEQFVPGLLRARPEDVHDYQQLYPAARQWQSLWQTVRAGEDHGYVAGTFHLFRLRASGATYRLQEPAGLRVNANLQLWQMKSSGASSRP